ncbi:heme-binding protein 2 [Lampris incognitus]|uniref:heme-binding protein 2 n=1 Tax=Lampris incognitus TaxID=2546036 RepID=UPI0024B5A347|nr:heme-binding protein 2 [Lampris incognitus]
MIFFAGLVVFLLLQTAEAGIGNSSESSFCTETNECLLFELVCQNEDYEVRHYDSLKWVSTNASSYFVDLSFMNSFRRLFKYLTGSNEDGANLDMTAPVVIKLNKKASFWQPHVYTMSFLLPSKYQKNPPKPTDDKVYFNHMSEMKVYVTSYGGWMLSSVAKRQAERLADLLDDAGAKYNHEYSYIVGYDSVMKLFNRHNEVWYEVEGEPVCPADN